jgi:hypothetical protein
MQYYDQILGRTPAPKQAMPNDSTNFPNSVEIVSRLHQESWGKDLQPIPSTVIDKGILRNVPYSSFKAGDYEMNVYGDLQNPAAVEIGVYRSLLNDNLAKEHCIQFVSSVLPSQKERDVLKVLNHEKDLATVDGLTIEFTPPTDEDAYGGWWISAYYRERLDASRASEKELAEITVPKEAPPPDSGWSNSDMVLARPTVPLAEIRVARIVIGREEYKNAYIVKRNPAEATIYHSTGVATYPIDSLGPEIQQQLGFDPNAAQAYRAVVAEARKNAVSQAPPARVAAQEDSSVSAPCPYPVSNSSGFGRVYVRDYQTYIGPRGGIYHYSASGRKVYERR